MGEDRLRGISRLGLIGVGAWGRRYIDTIGRRQDCLIAAFARASDQQDNLLPGARRCARWQDLVEMVGQGELDGVIVAATPALQAEVAQTAIAAGVPLLAEKPLGLSAAVVRALWRQQQDSVIKRPLLVDHIHLWAPAYQALKRHVADAAAGGVGIAAITSEGANRGPFRTWSALYDYGPHDLAMCLDLLGPGTPLHLTTAYKRLTGGTQPVGALFEAHFQGGRRVDVTTRFGNGAEAKVRLLVVTLGDGRRLIYDDTQPHPLKLRQNETPLSVEQSSPLDNIITDFLGQIADSDEGQFAPEVASASLALSVRVSELLADIDARANA